MRLFIIALLISFAPLFAYAHDVKSELKRAMKLKQDVNMGRKLYKPCAKCHSPEGWGSKNGRVPQIAGQHVSVCAEEIADIIMNVRESGKTKDHRVGGKRQKLQYVVNVCAYTSGLKMNPDNIKGNGKNLKQGKAIYNKKCAGCHGKDGAGKPKTLLPRMHGQHYEYLMRQYYSFVSGKRSDIKPSLLRLFLSLSQKDAEAVMDYMSRLKPPASMVAKPGWKNPDFN